MKHGFLFFMPTNYAQTSPLGVSHTPSGNPYGFSLYILHLNFPAATPHKIFTQSLSKTQYSLFICVIMEIGGAAIKNKMHTLIVATQT